MTFLLGTNAVSDLMRRDPNIERRVRSVSTADRVAVCTVVRGEVLYGIERLPQGKRKDEFQRKVDRIFRSVPCEPVPERVADQLRGGESRLHAQGPSAR